MEKYVKKIFLPWQEEKEQAFLEDMARKGYLLTRVQFCKYIFKQIEPTDLIFQSDFVDINVDKAEYLQIFEDAGILPLTMDHGIIFIMKKRQIRVL